MDPSPIRIESPVEHRTLDREGYSIHYYTSGDPDGELIIFLHPAFADHRCFDGQIDHFSKRYRVITVDLLGHGLSEVGKAKDRIDSSIEHIDSIIRSLGKSKAHFIGVSMGTLIGQYYALKNPEKVLSMTILGGYDINADNREISKAQRTENIKWILKALFSMSSFRKYVASVSVSSSEGQARFYQMATHFTRRSFKAMSGLGNVIKRRENVRRDYPLLILSGDRDLELARRVSRKWHDSEPGSEFFLIKDAGHCANMDRPEKFNEMVFDFLRSVD